MAALRSCLLVLIFSFWAPALWAQAQDQAPSDQATPDQALQDQSSQDQTGQHKAAADQALNDQVQQEQVTQGAIRQAVAEAAKQLNTWDRTLSQIEEDLQSGTLDHQQRNARRLTLVDLARQAAKAAERFTREQTEAQRLLEALGPAPGEGEPAEAPEVQRERNILQNELVAISALKGRSDLLVAKADLLLRQLDEVRIKAFAQELLTRQNSLLRRSTWQALPQSWQNLKSSIGARLTPRNLASEDQDQTRRLLLGLGALVVLLASVPVIRRLISWLDRKRREGKGEFTYGERVIAAVLETALRFFIPSFALLFILLTFLAVTANSTWGEVYEPIAIALATGTALAFFLAAVGHASIAPKLPRWGIVLLSPPSARALYRRWLVASGFLGLILALRMISRDLQPDTALESVANATEALIGSIILLSLLPARLWQRLDKEGEDEAPEEPEGEKDASSIGLAWLGEARWLRFVSLLCALVVLVAAILGYVALSDYVALSFLTITGVGFILLVLRHAIREGIHGFVTSGQKRYGGWLRLFIKSERGGRFLELLLFIVLDLGLILIALFAVLPSLGMAEDEVQVWLYGLLQGFSIAGVSIKPLNILLAILVFLLILAITRFVQRRLQQGALASLTPENSVQQSISTGIGYVGVIAAILLGINVVGFDLTNLALIAGALSVGIGFGLQNIVSNFVSGIILLIERPIKVGDWVVVGANEGVVKRISVRATEIETWQRSSVLIPNSDLVSTAVTNWTHKNKIGRVDVAVRVPFGTDPEKVHELLMKAAGDCKKVLADPPSYVFFKAFSPDGMDFDIRVYVHDIYGLIIDVANELRMAVVKHFNEAGIEMALPQRVVHLADMDRLEAEAFRRRSEAPEESAKESAEEDIAKR